MGILADCDTVGVKYTVENAFFRVLFFRERIYVGVINVVLGMCSVATEI